jgi:hypothetical protein
MGSGASKKKEAEADNVLLRYMFSDECMQIGAELEALRLAEARIKQNDFSNDNTCSISVMQPRSTGPGATNKTYLSSGNTVVTESSRSNISSHQSTKGKYRASLSQHPDIEEVVDMMADFSISAKIAENKAVSTTSPKNIPKLKLRHLAYQAAVRDQRDAEIIIAQRHRAEGTSAKCAIKNYQEAAKAVAMKHQVAAEWKIKKDLLSYSLSHFCKIFPPTLSNSMIYIHY